MKARAATLIIGLSLLAGGALLLGPFSRKAQGQQGTAPLAKKAAEAAPAAPPDRVDSVDIPAQATFGQLMSGSGVSDADTAAIYAASKGIYDLATIHAGKHIDLHYDPSSGALKELVYALNGDEE